jgi:Fic family protein
MRRRGSSRFSRRIAGVSPRRAIGPALRLHEFLQQNPFGAANALALRSGFTIPTVNAALAELGRLGIVEEVTGRRRGRVFSYRAYLEILNEGTTTAPA